MNHFFRLCLAASLLGSLAGSATAQQPPTATARAEAPAADPGRQPHDPPAASKKFDQRAHKLRAAIDAILGGTDATRGTVGIHAVDLATGQVLYSRGADQPMNPASNSKLITSAAALDAFGPSHTFETQLLADDDLADATIDGPLYVRGGGDAFLLYEDFMGWAGQLRQKGIRHIGGDLVVDDTLFDGAYLPPAFDQKQEDASYRSPIGAFSVNFNAVSVVVEPAAKPGNPPTCRMVPPNDHVEIVNRATTYAGRRRRIQVASNSHDKGTQLVITGKIGTRAHAFRSRRKRVDNPPLFAGSVLKEALQTAGIDVAGAVTTAKVPDTADPVVTHHSQPLSYIILAMNKWSNNFMAELLLRDVGAQHTQHAPKATAAPPTWKTSQKRVTDFLAKVGIDPSTVTIKNGSGLYDANRVSAHQFVTLLRYMHDQAWAPEYMSSLSIAGADGTLAHRMDQPPTAGNVRGKTGTLNEVSALSGYVTTESGRLVAFSILINDPPRFGWRYRPVQDHIVEAIAGFDG